MAQYVCLALVQQKEQQLLDCGMLQEVWYYTAFEIFKVKYYA